MSSSAAVADAFISAKREFFLRVPQRLKSEFAQYTSIEDVYQASEQIQAQQASTRTLRNLSKIQPFLDTLRQFNDVVDVFAQVKPEILGLIWGPIKWLLTVSSTFMKSYDKVLEAMSQIGALLPAFSAYSDLFKSNSKIQQVLCLFFQDVLDFHVSLLDLFKHQKWSVFFESLWPRQYGRIKVILNNIAQHRMLMDSEVSLAHITQEVQARRLALQKYDNDEKFQHRQSFNMVESTLAPVYYDEDLEHIKRTCTTQAGEWLRRHNGFQKWIDGSNTGTSLIWLQGIPGAGKTYLSSTVVRQLQLSDASLAFAIISYRSAEPASALKILHSFMFQLAMDRADLQALLIQIYDSNMRQLRSSVDFVLDVIKKFLLASPVAYFVIDGLDELSERERSLLLRVLLDLQGAVEADSKILKILIGSRAEDDIVRALSVRSLILRVQDNNKEDIEIYVDQRADAWLEGQWASPQVMFQIRRLMQSIAGHADGMFLYARLVCDSIVLKGDLDAVEEAVKDLPVGLNEAYGRAISRIEESLSASERKEAKFVLELIGSSLVPMSIHEIRLAVSVFHKKDPSRGCKDLFLNILQRCGAIVEDFNGKVQFVHFTLHEYLYGSQSEFYLSEQESHKDIAIVCLRYLTSSCFEPNVSATDLTGRIVSGAYVLENYICTYRIEHLNKAFISDTTDLESEIKPFFNTRYNPRYHGESTSRITHLGAFKTSERLLQEKLTEARAFARKRKIELCLSNNMQWEADDPFTTSAMQLRIDTCLKNLLCAKTPHLPGCQCSSLKTLYGDRLFKCSRFGCPFHRIGFATQYEFIQHMKMHTRPYKCDQEACEFAELGFRTQALLTRHLNTFHSQPLTKNRNSIKSLLKKDEFKLIVLDAVRQDDLALISDVWEEASKYGPELLLTTIEESSSQRMIDYLIDKVQLADDLSGLRKVLRAAAEKGVVAIFQVYNVQQLAVSFEGEKTMVNILNRAATSRLPELITVVWRQVPPMFHSEFVARLIPSRPDQSAEAMALECLHVIVNVTPRRRLCEAFEHGLRVLGTKCCSIPIAELLVKHTHNFISRYEPTRFPPLFHASGNTTLEAANLVKYFLDNGAFRSILWERSARDLSQRPGAKNIHHWLGVTWEELISKYEELESKKNALVDPNSVSGFDTFAAPDSFNLDFSTLENHDVLENFDFDSFLGTFNDEKFDSDYRYMQLLVDEFESATSNKAPKKSAGGKP